MKKKAEETKNATAKNRLFLFKDNTVSSKATTVDFFQTTVLRKKTVAQQLKPTATRLETTVLRKKTVAKQVNTPLARVVFIVLAKEQVADFKKTIVLIKKTVVYSIIFMPWKQVNVISIN